MCTRFSLDRVGRLFQVSFAAPKDSTGIRGSGTSVREPASRPALPSTDPKKDVETINPKASGPAATPTRPPYLRPAAKDCPGAHDGPSTVTITLLETRADQLEVSRHCLSPNISLPRKETQLLGEKSNWIWREINVHFTLSRRRYHVGLPCIQRKWSISKERVHSKNRRISFHPPPFFSSLRRWWTHRWRDIRFLLKNSINKCLTDLTFLKNLQESTSFLPGVPDHPSTPFFLENGWT